MKTYSISYNKKRATWIAQIKQLDGSWKTKFLPKSFQQHQQLDAERWLINFISNYHTIQNEPTSDNSNLAPCSIFFLHQKWLYLKESDLSIAPNTLTGMKLALKNWILNSNFPHFPIQDIDITALSTQDLLSWCKSLQGSPATKLQQIYVLKTFLHDAIVNEWVKDIPNPADKPAIKQYISKLHAERTSDKVITHLSAEQVKHFLTVKTKKIADMRKVRYLLAITSGLRISELHGLVFADVDFTKKTLQIQRQVMKPGIAPAVNYKDTVRNTTISNAIVKAPKKGSRRELPLHNLTVAALEYWYSKGWELFTGRKPQLIDPIFPRSKTSLKKNQIAGSFLAGTHQAEQFQEDLLRADLPTSYKGEELTFHSLRHTFSHLLELAGAEDSKIQVLLGHGAKSVLRTSYLGAQVEAYRNLINSLNIGTVLELTSCSISCPSPSL